MGKICEKIDVKYAYDYLGNKSKNESQRIKRNEIM